MGPHNLGRGASKDPWYYMYRAAGSAVTRVREPSGVRGLTRACHCSRGSPCRRPCPGWCRRRHALCHTRWRHLDLCAYTQAQARRQPWPQQDLHANFPPKINKLSRPKPLNFRIVRRVRGTFRLGRDQLRHRRAKFSRSPEAPRHFKPILKMCRRCAALILQALTSSRKAISRRRRAINTHERPLRSRHAVTFPGFSYLFPV